MPSPCPLPPTSDLIVMTKTTPLSQSFSRRDALRIGGLSVGFAALLAACGGNEGDAAPARVGVADPARTLDTVGINDGVLWRTAASLHYSVIDAHKASLEHGNLSAAQQGIVNGYIAANTSAIAEIDSLAAAAGAQPYGCANPRFNRVILTPLVDRITGRPKKGSEEEDVPPTDDATRDALALAYSMETVAAATHQAFVQRFSDGAGRASAMGFAQAAARRAAALALAINPGNLIAPTMIATANLGTETTLPDDNRQRYYAVPSQFGTLSATQLAIGEVSEAGTQFTMNIDTPSLNSFVYDGETC